MGTGTFRISRCGRAWVLGVSVLALAVPAQAMPITWDGGGADANWTTGNNWDTNTVPLAADDVVFGSAFTSGTGISLAGADRTVNSLTIDTAAGLVIGPGESARTLTLNNSNLTRTAASKGEQSVQSKLYLGGSSGTWDIQGSGRLVLGSLYTYNGSYGTLTKQGSGEVDLTAGNTLYGVFALNAGTLGLNGGNLGNGTTLQLNGGALYALTTGQGLDRNMTINADTLLGKGIYSLNMTGTTVLTGTRTLTVADTSTTTLGGIVSQSGGSFGLTKAGSGTLILSATNTYTGPTVIKEGMLRTSASITPSVNGQLGNSSSAILLGDTTGAGNATLWMQGVDNATNGRSITVQGGNTGIATIGAANTANIYSGTINLQNHDVTLLSSASAWSAVNFTGALTGTGNVTVRHDFFANYVTFGGTTSNTYAGATNVFGGWLYLNRAGQTAIPGDLVIGDGVSQSRVDLATSEQIANSASVTVNRGGSFNLVRKTETINNLTINGGGYVDCFGDSGGGVQNYLTVNGNLTMGGGKLQNGALKVVGDVIGSGSVYTSYLNSYPNNSFKLDLNGTTHNFTIANGQATDDVRIESEVSNGSLVKLGAGKLTIGNTSNDVAGVANLATNITVNEGTLLGYRNFINGTTALLLGDTSGAADATLQLYQPNTNGSTVNRPITVQAGSAGTATIGFKSTSGSYAGAITLNKDVTISGEHYLDNQGVNQGTRPGGTFVLSGAISGTGGITKTGQGTVFLSNSTNSFGGTVTVKDGVLGLNTQTAGTGAIQVGEVGGTKNVGLWLSTPFTSGDSFNRDITFNSGTGRAELWRDGNSAGNWLHTHYTGTLTINRNVIVNIMSSDNDMTFDLEGNVTGTGKLIKYGPYALEFGHIAAPGVANFTGGTEVGYGMIRYHYAPAAAATITSQQFGTGTITLLNNGGFDFYANPTDASKICTFTNDFAVTGGNSGSMIANPAGTSTIIMSGAMGLGGVLTIGNKSYSYGGGSGEVSAGSSAATQWTGTVTIDQASVAPRAISFYRTWSSDSQLKGNIVDGAGAAGNALTLRAQNGTLSVMGTGNTYAGGTVIPYGNGIVSVSSASSLGGGNVMVQAGGLLKLAGSGNVASGKSVTVQSNSYATGIVSLGGNFLPIIDGSSSGVLGIDAAAYDNAGANLNQSALGNGSMYLGSISSGTYTGTTLGAGSGSTYRLGGGGSFEYDPNNGLRGTGNNGTLTVQNGVLTGGNNLIVGSTLQNGSGAVVLAAANTFSGGSITVNLNSLLKGVGQTGAASPFGTGNNITINGGALRFDRNVTTGTATTATVGTLTVNGNAYVQVQSDSNTTPATLALGGLSLASGATMVIFNQGNSDLNPLGGREKITVAGWASKPLADPHVVEAWYTNNPQLVAYDSTNGFQRAAYTIVCSAANSLAAGVATDLVDTKAVNQTLTGNVSVSAIKMTSDITSASAVTLTLTSGLLAYGGGALNANVSLAFADAGGTAIEGVVYAGNSFGNQATGITRVAKGNGLTKFGPGDLSIDTIDSTNFTGLITVNQGGLAVKTSWGGATGVVINGGQLGSYNYNSVTGNVPLTVGANGLTLGNWAPAWTGKVSGSGLVVANGNLNWSNTANDFTGDIIVNGRTVYYYGDSALGNASNRLIMNGALLQPNVDLMNVPSTRRITLVGGGMSVNLSDGKTLTIDGVIDGMGQLQTFWAGSGKLILTNTANSFVGPILVGGGSNGGFQQGFLQYSDDRNLGDAANVVTLYGGATQNSGNGFLMAGAPMTTARNIHMAGGGGFHTNGNAVTYTGTLDGYGDFMKVGNGVLTFAGTNTMAGTMRVHRGTLAITGDAALGSVSNMLYVGAGNGALNQGTENGTLQVNGSFASSRPIGIGSGGTFEITGSNTLTLSGPLSGYTGFIKTGTGTLIVTADNSETYNASTTISAGKLGVSTDMALGNTAYALNLNNGATFLAADTFTSGRPIVLGGTGGGTIEVANTKTLTIDAPISGSQALTKAGNGTLVLLGMNSYSGGTTVSAGALQITVGNGSDDSGSTNPRQNGGLTGNILNQGTVIFNQTVDGLYQNAISGAGAVVKSGAGLLTLTVASTYGGSTTISGGILRLAASNLLPDGSQVTLGNEPTAALNLNGFSDSIGSLAGGGGAGGAVRLTGGTLTIGNDNANAEFAGIISSTGSPVASLTKVGTGTQTLSGTNAYVGRTTVSGGGLRVGVAGALPAGSNLSLNGGVLETRGSFYTSQTFNGTGMNQRVLGVGSEQFTWSSGGFAAYGSGPADDLIVPGGMPGAPTFGSGTASRTVLYTGAISNIGTVQVVSGVGTVPEAEFSGPITGGALTLNGTGVLALTGANSYAGGTIINGGTLLANNGSGSATGSGGVTVNSGGTLGGTGSVIGPVTVNSGGSLAPGTSPGTLEIVGNLTFTPGAMLLVELGGTVPGDGAGFYDQVNVTGTALLDGNLDVAFYDGFLNPLFTDRFTILTRNLGTGIFAGLQEGAYFQVAGSGYVGRISYVGGDGNDVVLYNLIPEPGALCLLGFAGAWLLRLRRRRGICCVS